MEEQDRLRNSSDPLISETVPLIFIGKNSSQGEKEMDRVHSGTRTYFFFSVGDPSDAPQNNLKICLKKMPFKIKTCLKKMPF